MREGIRLRRGLEAKTIQLNEKTELQERLASKISQMGVFSRILNPITKKESTVVDENALASAIEATLAEQKSGSKEIVKESLPSVLSEVLGSRPVLTKKGTEQGEYTEKSFLYVPESADAATDSVSIKSAPSFHHFVTDFYDQSQTAMQYPTAETAGAAISGLETKVAAVLFHPDLGDGFRNEKNRLFVRNKETRKYEPFSAAFFREYGLQNKFKNHGDSADSRSVRDRVSEELPHLVAKGLLRPVEDLRQMTYGRGSVSDQRVDRVGVSSSGSRYIRGVSHYIGKEFFGKQVRVLDISPTVGVVVDTSTGSERVTHLFNLIPREQAKAGKSNMFLAGASLTQPRAFSAETISAPRRDDESSEQYRDRIEKTDRGLAHLLLRVIPKNPELAKMLRDRPLYEQAAIAQAAFLLERNKEADRFDAFVQRYGESGARTFLVTANNDIRREQVFTLGETLPQEKAKAVFNVHGRVIDTVAQLSAYLREEFGTTNEAVVDDVTQKILHRGAVLLASAYKYREDPNGLVGLIADVEEDTQLFLDACRTLRQRGELTLEAIRGGELEISSAIQKDDAEVMIGIQEAQYAGKYPENEMTALHKGLQTAMADGQARFYLYRKDGEIVSFVRFEESKRKSSVNELYMGSLMTNPKFNGGALGQALLESALHKETENATIRAVCDPGLVPFYEKFGFRKLGEYKDEFGVPTCDIVLEARGSSMSQAA